MDFYTSTKSYNKKKEVFEVRFCVKGVMESARERHVV